MVSKMYEEAKKVSEVLKTIANPNRLMLLCTLIEGDMTVGELESAIGTVGQSAISQHLAILRAAGFVDSSKRGQQVTYRISDHRIEAVIAALKQHYCA